ncbi:MAG: ABC transporter permease [Pelagibacteraceae bacterium]|nr:ABC transporter permease [Pelagibacteraceae bacterium]
MSSVVDKSKVPWWVSNLIVPIVNLILALLVSALFIFIAGENPIEAVKLIIYGSFGYIEGFAYTLYYTTNFIFTGLAFAVAFHCRLFNIGGEGQAYIGGLGVYFAAIHFSFLPVPIVWILAIAGAIVFGGAWAFIPAYLQAKRGSHVVITTIMFNFIASSLMIYLLVDVIRDTNQMGPHTIAVAKELWFPTFKEFGELIGIKVRYSPLNLSFLLAIAASVFVWFLVWRTKWGYEMRAVGHNTQAAIYAGISPYKNIIIAMVISGGLAGLLAINEVLGVHHKIVSGFPSGYGFTGIAVALMGRNHPIGIFPAALLFGILYQGGSEVTFDMPNISRYMFVAVQGVIILFSGALENLFRPQVESFFVNKLNIRKKG